MQTFIPNGLDVSCLDGKRLWNQVNECKAIWAALTGSKAWSFHPATAMWRGFNGGLVRYVYHLIIELEARGKEHLWRPWNAYQGAPPEADLPGWLYNAGMRERHQANLVRKDAKHYGPLWPGVTASDVYIWPLWQDGRWRMRQKQVGAKAYLEDLPDQGIPYAI